MYPLWIKIATIENVKLFLHLTALHLPINTKLSRILGDKTERRKDKEWGFKTMCVYMYVYAHIYIPT